MENISKQMFQNLIKLKALYLKRNRITDIPGFTFENQTSLEKLSLGMKSDFLVFDYLLLFFPGENQFEILSKDAFKNLGKVAKLYVLNNQIEIIPSRVFEDLHSLIELSLGMNIDNLLRLFMVFWFNLNQASTISDS